MKKDPAAVEKEIVKEATDRSLWLFYEAIIFELKKRGLYGKKNTKDKN